jgi:hypothetical protein
LAQLSGGGLPQLSGGRPGAAGGLSGGRLSGTRAERLLGAVRVGRCGSAVVSLGVPWPGTCLLAVRAARSAPSWFGWACHGGHLRVIASFAGNSLSG